MDKDKEIEDRHEIASIINGCLSDGYCTASHLARRITQSGYGNIKRAVKEFAEKLKEEIAKLPKDVLTFSLMRQGPQLIDYLITELYGTPCDACPDNNNAEYNESTCPNKGECGK